MSEFNLEREFGRLMEKVETIEKNIVAFEEHLREKASKAELEQITNRLNELERKVKPILENEIIKQNDKRRFLSFISLAPALWTIVIAIISCLFSAGFHALHGLFI